jgi:hypothetical protein
MTDPTDKLYDDIASGVYYDEYSEYIMEQAPIGNGDMLIEAMESGMYEEGFAESLISRKGGLL